MVITDTLEGTIDGVLIYHYDVSSDVLYLRLLECENEQTVAEESPKGYLVLRTEKDDRLAGLTIVNWWKGHGKGVRTDSIHELEAAIEPWIGKLEELKRKEARGRKVAVQRGKARK